MYRVKSQRQTSPAARYDLKLRRGNYDEQTSHSGKHLRSRTHRYLHEAAAQLPEAPAPGGRSRDLSISEVWCRAAEVAAT